MTIKDRYPQENGLFIIDIKIDSLEQLFDKRDPNPFRIKDLDEDAEEYILSSLQEIGIKKLGKIRIISSLEDPKKNDEANRAVKDFFLYREEITRRKLRSILLLGVKTLILGLLFLSGAILVSLFMGHFFPKSFLGLFFKEGFLLIGWVSMWRPLNIFLYEWWPLLELKKQFHVLSSSEIAIVTSKQ